MNCVESKTPYRIINAIKNKYEAHRIAEHLLL